MKTNLVRAVAVFLLSAFAITAAWALSVDQTRIFNVRSYANYQPYYYRVTVNFNDPLIASAQQFGQLGASDFIDQIDCHVTTAFNTSTTNNLTFGTSKANANEILAAGSVSPGTTGIYHLTTAAGLGVQVTSAGAVPFYAKYAGVGATTGAVTCVFEIMSNNDN
jgi:hypothetical protein